MFQQEATSKHTIKEIAQVFSSFSLLAYLLMYNFLKPYFLKVQLYIKQLSVNKQISFSKKLHPNALNCHLAH